MSSDRWTREDFASYQARRGLKLEIVSVEPKPNKYRNEKSEVDGIVFASKREAARYQELRILEREGLIGGLTLQPKYPLTVNGEKVGTYIGDFAYIENQEVVVEDAKGMKTAVYRLKRKLMKAIYGIEIRES